MHRNSVEPMRMPRLRPADRRGESVLVASRDDPSERLADEIADRIMRMPDPAPGLVPGRLDLDRVAALAVHRQAVEEPEEPEAPEEPYPFPPEPIGIGMAVASEELDEDGARTTVAARAASSPGAAPPSGGGSGPSLPASPGAALDRGARRWMEPRLGVGLGAVRVHADPGAAQAARALRADAFTVGGHIYFAQGRYQPDTGPGRRLLAHELAHVLQTVDGRHGAVARRSIASAFANYRDTCDCGEDLGNNCAHYLSDAFIRSGYQAELDGGVGAKYRRFNGRLVCRNGRPVRAKEFRDWFASKASTVRQGEPTTTGYWAVYQERRSDGQGHVNIHSHRNGAYGWVGTTDLPTWRTQSHHTW